MPPPGAARRGSEGGFITIEYVAAVALSLVALVAITNLAVFEYGQGVVRTAVDQGVREGARAPAPSALATCRQAAQQVIDDLLGGRSGSMGASVAITCSRSGGLLDAAATASFAPWLRPLPRWSFSSRATAVVEPPG